MNNRKAVTVVGFVALAVFALTLVKQVGSGHSVQAQAKSGSESPKDTVPQSIVYRHLFHHIVLLQRKADEEERQGRDGSAFRSLYRRQAQLDEKGANQLNEIASDCDRLVEDLNEKARKMTKAYRALTPKGRLEKGQTPPPPPADLKALWEQRNEVITQARERLRTVFGEAEFQRFDGFVQNQITSNIRRIDPARSTWPDEPHPEK